MTEVILALNAGSSSIKIQVLPVARDAPPLMTCTVERIGSENARVLARVPDGAKSDRELSLPDHAAALQACAQELEQTLGAARVVAVAHRLVHGGKEFAAPVKIGPAEEQALTDLIPLAPLHLPGGLAGIRAARDLFPEALQVGCFDTGFHAAKPRLHDRFALPARLYEAGLRRYGFHGLSCQSILRKLQEVDGTLPGTLIIAHLGNGCSVTAVNDGRSFGSSMGFSTLDGMAMGTRCGRIDPGALLYLLREGMSVDDLEDLLYRESGLLGLSGLSNDMRDLQASDSPAAKEAIDYFTSSCAQEISRAAAVLGGVETVVFCGGIGENAAPIRDRIIGALGFLRSPEGGRPQFRVVPTDEERELAIAAREVLAEALAG
ncbi:MAG: acetate kinase [Rhodobacteraceae bacterium]|nr:acetate kinase [Paracoccaceae bacterium]